VKRIQPSVGFGRRVVLQGVRPDAEAEGNLQGLQSIRVNDQWRIVFRWTAEGPDEVDVRDDH
jgi:hypothetical protein